MERRSDFAVLLLIAAALGACESNAGVAAAACDAMDAVGAAPFPRACRLTEAGPFLSHESRGARPGDVLMASALARFYITGSPGADGYVPFAGWVIDADVVRSDGDVDYDGVDGFYPVVNVAPISAQTVAVVKDGSDGREAVVRVKGRIVAVPAVLSVRGAEPRPVPVSVTLTYSLGPQDRALRVSTRVVNLSGSPQPVEIGDVILFGDDEAEPFTVPGGFDLQSDARELDAIGSSHEWRAASYALFAADGPLTLFEGSSVQDQVGGGDSSLWGYTLAARTLEPHRDMEAVRYLSVARDISTALSPRPSVAGDETGHIRGRVLASDRPVAGARISIFEGPDLRVFAGQAVSDAAGAFDIAVPPGRYHVVATGRTNGEHVEVPGRTRELAEGFFPSSVEEVPVEAGASSTLDLELGPAARAAIVVHDGAGAPTPAKVTFQAEDARPDPLLAAGERVPYASLGVRQVVWVPAGTAELNIEPGLYTVTASHGFGAELDVQSHVELAAGERTQVEMTVPEVVQHAGHVAIDSHVHGFYSQHGEVTPAERVITAAAEGLRVHIATDHDWVADYSPAIPTALRDRLISAPGVELTAPGGHHCMWPLRRDPTRPRGGAALWWAGGDLDDWYGHYREMGATVMQVAHGTDYFRRAGYDPATGQVDRGAASFTWAFNAMEVHNGKGGGGREALVPIWFSLMNWGHRIAPLAASDCHWRVPEVGTARTYVRVGDTSSFDVTDVARAVNELRTVASTGPFIDLHSAGGARPGDTVRVDSGGEVSLGMTVWAPAWMPVAEVELVRDGEVVERWDQATQPAVALDPSRAVWFAHELIVKPGADAWYAVQVRGHTDLAPVYPNVQPWALTAPLFVDVDRDGQIEPRCIRASCAASAERGASSPPVVTPREPD